MYMGRYYGQNYDAIVEGSLDGAAFGDRPGSNVQNPDGSYTQKVHNLHAEPGGGNNFFNVEWIVFKYTDPSPSFLPVYNSITYLNKAGIKVFEIPDVNSESRWLPPNQDFFWLHQRIIHVDNRYDDTFMGNKYSDIMWGGPGNDSIFGNGGDDHVTGGPGDDYFNLGPGNDTADGGSGWDLLDLAGLRSEYAFVNQGNGLIGITGKGQHEVIKNIEEVRFSNGQRANVDDLVHIPPAQPKPVNINGNYLNNILTGNELNNVIKGGAGNDTLKGLAGDDELWGGTGHDNLWGGPGSDAFVFKETPSSLNYDYIRDFAHGTDGLYLNNAFFTKVGVDGELSSAAFWSNYTGLAHDSSDRIVYNKSNGYLYYDDDGTGAHARQLVAVLTTKPVLSASDFLIT